MPERSRDWIAQAKRDLEVARWAKDGKFFEWACFISQQSAEKAVKAVYQKFGGEAWGHSVFLLLKGIKEKVDVPEEVLTCAKNLDRFYVPTRYPNGWAEGIPMHYYDEKDAKDAISCAEKILRCCDHILAE